MINTYILSVFPDYGEVDVCGIRLGIQAAPMFHAMGSIVLAWAICGGFELAVFKPSRPPIVAHPTSFLNDLVSSKSEWAMSVPAHIEVGLPDYPFRFSELTLLKGVVARS